MENKYILISTLRLCVKRAVGGVVKNHSCHHIRSENVPNLLKKNTLKNWSLGIRILDTQFLLF